MADLLQFLDQDGRGADMKRLTAFCDLATCPISWDFGTWLVRAMLERDHRGCDALHVVLVPKEDGLGGFARHWGDHDEAATRWRLWHIVMPCIPLAGKNTTVTLAPTRGEAEWIQSGLDSHEHCREEDMLPVWRPEGRAHFMGPLVLAARDGKAIPKLAATEAARRNVASWFSDTSQVVTLTTRSQSTHRDRNSQVDEWTKLEKWLAPRFEVVRLRDTMVGLACDTGPWALLDPDLRLALYERAQMNLIGNNGPSTLMRFSTSPFMTFGEAPTQEWRDHYRRYFHMEHGDQLPWCRPDQRLVYEPDTFEVMSAKFKEWEATRGNR